MPMIPFVGGKMNATQMPWILFFLKISLLTTYGTLWLWAKRSHIKTPQKNLKEKDNRIAQLLS